MCACVPSRAVEVGFAFAEGFEAVAVAADAVLEEIRRQSRRLRRPRSSARACARRVRSRPASIRAVPPVRGRSLSVTFAQVGECLLDQVAVAVQLGELGEHGGFEPVFGEPVAVAFGGSVLVAGGAGVVGVAAVAAVR